MNGNIFSQLAQLASLDPQGLSWMTKNVARVGGTAMKTELLNAIQQNNVSRVREIILQQNLQPLINDTHVVGYAGETLMTSAAEWGAADVLELLVREFGADPNLGDEDGDLPLTTAAICGHYEAAVRLVEVCGADVNKQKDGQSASDFAKSNKRTRVYEYLVEAERSGCHRPPVEAEREEKMPEVKSPQVKSKAKQPHANSRNKTGQKAQRKKAKKSKKRKGKGNQTQTKEAQLSSTIADQRTRIIALEEENERLAAELEERKLKCPTVDEIRGSLEQCSLDALQARLVALDAYADLVPDVKRKIEELQAHERSCVVCMDSDRTHVAVPCGHRCLCQDCAGTGDVMTCPICREEIERWLRVFC